MDYRDQFFQRYVSTHFGSIREISPQACESHRHTFRSYFKKHLPKSTQAKILDIGCGYGSFLYFLQKEGYQDIYGVEISPEQVNAAKRIGIPNVSFGDLSEYLSAHQEQFDCIVALDVIEHFPKSEICALLELAFHALRGGGSIILQVPNGGSPFSGMIRYGDFTHEVSFTKHSVVQILELAGFVGTQVFPTGPVVHGLKSAIRWVLWRASSFVLKGYLALETGQFGGHILTQNLIAVSRKPSQSKTHE